MPRGALFGGRSTCSTGSAMDTAEVRSNDRKLLFPESGMVTMRPSDVPTYVEHGAADVGITGKDVLLEQAEREVYELLDLGFGRCRMIVAARARATTRSASRCAGSAAVRIATKYPRIAARPLRRDRAPGRDRGGEGLGGARAAHRAWSDGIVDLTATGTTLAENDLVELEEIVECTARLIANPVAHKLKAAADRRAGGADPGAR